MDFAIFSKTEVEEMFQTMIEHMPENISGKSAADYRNQMELSKDQDRRYILFIPEAGEDVEFFVNGTSQGIQILPPFLYDITEAVQDGENDIRIEVATTLERERGANKENRHRLGFIVR